MLRTRQVIGGWMMLAVVGLAVIVGAQDDNAAMVAALASRAERLVVARCSVCHSADLISQQRLPHLRWEATVEKMKQWGAEISRMKPICSCGSYRRGITPAHRTGCLRLALKLGRWNGPCPTGR